MTAPHSDPSTVTRNIPFVRRGEQELVGDLYLPAAAAKMPAVVALHGGAWKLGHRAFYQYIGPYLAARGIAVFAASYRLVDPASGKGSYPAAVQDARAAVQFIRTNAERWNLDPARIGVMGDSAGAHLSSLVAFAGDRAPFAGHPDDAFPGVSCRAKVLVGIYGVYDLIAQWRHDLVARTTDNIAQNFLGTSPVDDRHLFHEASPLTYATTAANSMSVFLAWGGADSTVDPATQSLVLLEALQQARYYVRTFVLQDAPHFWSSDPIDEAGSFAGQMMPKLTRFLTERL